MKYAILKHADNGKFYLNIYDTNDNDAIEVFSTRGDALKYLMRNGYNPLGPSSLDGKQEWMKEEVTGWV